MIANRVTEHQGANGFDDVSDGLIFCEGSERGDHGVGRCESGTRKGERENNQEAHPLHGFHAFGDQTENGGNPGDGEREQQHDADDNEPVSGGGYWSEADEGGHAQHDKCRQEVAYQVRDHVA